MKSLLLIKADDSAFERSEVEQVFRANANFRDIRFDTPVGDLIACKYVDSDDWTLIDLDKDRQCISISNTGRAALQVVLIIQRALGIPLRLFNSSYTFDLTVSDISTVKGLEAAMDNAPTS